MILRSLRQELSSLRVGQKIGLGYALALGIAVSGTIAGFAFENYWQEKTEQRETHSRNEVELLHRLQSRVLQARTHQQQLIPLAQYPEKFEDEYAHLMKHEAEIKETWTELKAFVAEPLSLEGQIHQEMPVFLQTYDRVPQRYIQELERRVQRIRKLNLASPTDVEQARALMLEFTNSDLALELDGISDDLVGLIDHAYQELEEAAQARQQAGEVAQIIMVVSIVLSIAIAVLLAILTSRAISQPIEALTDIARRSTEESNFDLEDV
jgi:nitrogen fixation/metabolism regulation signal transduction histidine kinase